MAYRYYGGKAESHINNRASPVQVRLYCFIPECYRYIHYIVP